MDKPICGETGVQAPLPGLGVFIRHQHGATPFAAEPDALKHPEHQQRYRSPDADLGVGRNEPDKERGDAHDHQRQHEHALSTEAVAEVPEDNAAQRARDEADREGRVGQ